MKIKELIQTPPSETYIKNSSRLVSGLFIIGGLLYYPTNGYGAVISLALALILLFGQKMLLTQANKDFTDMYQAKQFFEQTQNTDYLRFIMARSEQMLKDNKVLSDKAKREIHQLREYSEEKLENENS
ncbi:hypothetical protein [Rodentibacter pneumotropicus]|uniref:Methyl-accepting chemotaxis protein n=2 Tax=Rodentibacter pneumotropicus TaxID=758 RepID=A0AAW5L8Z9_9PAST|nr:hypothetical protein [Rodentibacter pneumotropicus]MCQ9120397.1 hypothetical protein [Rodentibacter pneumotropicus]NBH74915.1 hypothetical protein [Rodentibacter pneumotropicus]OOF63896.1 hypothetical protein BH925_00635 [Rodentibacter pneumotropicus]OOF66864.1 hypothetical protein BKG95_09230 [Rodentibacter pneumotropicus]THA08236.1 hypothetical protein D3M73_00530 [Rodentibacter pneumotropicus]